MKKFLLVTVALVGFLSPALSEDNYFYKKGINKWGVVYGDLPGENDGKCSAETIYADNDGSYAQLNKNLATGELYLFFKNTDWEISDAPITGKVLINVYNTKNTVILSGTLNADIQNKNSIRLGNLDPDLIIKIFSKGSYFRVVMPNNIKNIIMPVNSAVLDSLIECINTSKKITPPKKAIKGESL